MSSYHVQTIKEKKETKKYIYNSYLDLYSTLLFPQYKTRHLYLKKRLFNRNLLPLKL
jgi:hypothetical protein